MQCSRDCYDSGQQMVDPTGHDQEECAASERNSDTCSVLLCETPTQQTAGLNEMQWCLLGSTWLFLPDMGEEHVPRASAIFISPAALGIAGASRSYFSETAMLREHSLLQACWAAIGCSCWTWPRRTCCKQALQSSLQLLPCTAWELKLGQSRLQDLASAPSTSTGQQ